MYFLIARPFFATCTFLLYSYALLPTICASGNVFSGAPINQGASNSYSPFYQYSETLSQGWRIRLRSERDVLLYSPTASAGGPLESFYLDLLARVNAQLQADAPPVRSLVVHMGALMMVVSAHSTPIPWELIGVFAGRMLEATRRGYTAGYSVSIQPPEGDASNAALITFLNSFLPFGLPRGPPTLMDLANAIEDLETDESLATDDEISDNESDTDLPCKRDCAEPSSG